MTKHPLPSVKHIRILILSMIATTVNLSMQAQVDTMILQDTTVPSQILKTVPPNNKWEPNKRFNKNDFKINVTSLGIKNYHFTYERLLARKLSAALSYRTMPSSTLGNLKLVNTALEIMGEDKPGGLKDDLNKIIASNKTVTLEFRIYKGKKPGAKGFYTGLFGRYGNFNLGYDYTYVDGNSKSYLIPIQAKSTAISGGLQLGAQFNVFKHITVDLQLLGLHFGKLTGEAMGKANLSAMSEDDKQMLKTEIEELSPKIKRKRLFPVNAQVTSNGINAKMNGPFAGLRTGISIGLAL